MDINYNVTGNRRKQLVRKLTDLLGEDAKYLGMPTMAFEIGCYSISRNGVVSPEPPREIVDALADAGFVGERIEVQEPLGTTITIPMTDLTDHTLENLKNMVESKSALIKQAFGVEELRVEHNDDTLYIRWFEDKKLTQEEMNVATELVCAMIAKCKSQRHVSAKPVQTDNPKYALRVWLNNLGFVGKEHKALRKELLKDLPGSSAFRHPLEGK